jgi:GGDEF domain-containing protein
MRTRVFCALFAFVVLTVLAVTVAAHRLLVRGLDSYGRGLVQTELGSLVGQFEALPAEERDLAHLKELVRNYRLGRHGYAWESSPFGQSLYHSDRVRLMDAQFVAADHQDLVPLLRARPQGATVELGARGLARYVSYRTLDLPAGRQGDPARAVLGVCYPLEDLAGITETFRKGLMVAAGGLLLLGMAGSLLVSWLATAPVSALAGYALGLARDQQPSPPVLPADLELRQILTSLQQLWGAARRTSGDPLTGLPGSRELEAELFARIDAGRPFAVGVVDAKHFAAYNRAYGFERGDAVIRLLSLCLSRALRDKGHREDPLYHLGADRFAFVTTPDRVEAVCQAVVADFEAQVPLLYTPEDRARGGLISKDRQGNFQRFPFMALSIAVATNRHRPLIHPLQIGHITAEILEHLKGQPGSVYLVDRRTQDRPPPEPAEGPSSPQPAGASTSSEPAEPSAVPRDSAEGPMPSTPAPGSTSPEPVRQGFTEEGVGQEADEA